jgi:hypothetical protein
MTWILWVSAAIVALVMLDAIWLAAMFIGHKLHEMAFRKNWNRMPSRRTPFRVDGGGL